MSKFLHATAAKGITISQVFSGNSRVKKINLVIDPVCTYSSLYSEHIFLVLSIYVQYWQRYEKKSHSFCMTTMTMTWL